MVGKLNIAIIGCGPGGLAAALFLNRQGHAITIFDQFSEPLPVGSGLLIQPSGQLVLEQLGLLDRIRALASPVQQLHGISVEKNRRALDMQYAYSSDARPALGIHRASLFSVLLNEVKEAAIPVVANSKLTGMDETQVSIAPVFEGGLVQATFDCLIDASGARSPVAGGQVKRLDYGAFWATVDVPEKYEILPAALDQRYFRASQMAGIMPIGLNPATGNPGAALFWSEKPENADELIASGIDAFRQNYCDLWPAAEPFVSQLQSIEELNLAVYHHRTGLPSSSNRLFYIGDSWHCTSPQLGQGANMALIDAAALAKALEQSSSLSIARKKYRKARMRHIKLYQVLSIIFTPLYQSDSRIKPWIRDMVIHNFARWPIIRNFIAKTVSGRLFLSP
ncbi:NAD(P)/FAD-dependent oxidoreductase [Parasphingorhabdus sp.]|uniref:FAD-dependent oxidoreductase n=1 Tax=Parasphingorhabdus sp. TaxID=2709688 RepID=UPI0032678F0D